MIRYLSLTMCLGLLATGCQSTSPTACAPGQKPPKAPWVNGFLAPRKSHPTAQPAHHQVLCLAQARNRLYLALSHQHLAHLLLAQDLHTREMPQVWLHLPFRMALDWA